MHSPSQKRQRKVNRTRTKPVCSSIISVGTKQTKNVRVDFLHLPLAVAADPWMPEDALAILSWSI
jgi:hypothetical protein